MRVYDSPTLQAAKAYRQAGLSVIPIRTDGTKALALKAGQREQFEKELASMDQITSWFGLTNRPPGIAVLCGTVSGNLECIDFDQDAKEHFEAWRDLVGTENAELVSKLVVNQTPRPGYHVVYRVAEPVGGSQKLASRPGVDVENARITRETLIETRGDGGYFIVPGSPERTHASGRPWCHHAGPRLSKVQTITIADRELLLTCARALNIVEVPQQPRAHAGHGIRPCDDYEQRGPDWPQILEPHGWRLVFQRGDIRYWRRPGKETEGCSATTGRCTDKDGAQLFYVFSSNAHPFEAEHAYGKFRTYTLLNHSGDVNKAAAALRDAGFGEQKRASTSSECRTIDDVARAIRVQTARLRSNDPKGSAQALDVILSQIDKGMQILQGEM